MGARKKIEELTNAWYGFAIFGGLVALLSRGIGLWSLFVVGGSTLFSIFVSWFVGRRLLAKSYFTRVVTMFLAAISSLTGSYGTYKAATVLLTSFSLGQMLVLALVAAGTWMNVRSFMVLRDPEVRSYFR